MTIITYENEYSNVGRKVCWKGERISFQVCNESTPLEKLDGPNGSTITTIFNNGLYKTKAGQTLILDVIAPPKEGHTDKWISVNIPTDAVPGEYRGTSGNDIFIVEVLDLTLPPVRKWKFHLDLWQNPWAVARYHKCVVWSPHHTHKLIPHLQLLADAGQKVITTTVVENVWASQTFDSHGSMVTWNTETDVDNLTFDFSIFEHYVTMCRSCGISGPIHCFSVLPWGTNQGCGHKDGMAEYAIYKKGERYVVKAAPGDKIYTILWTQFLVAFSTFVRTKGWKDSVVFAFDERHESEMIAALAVLQTLPEDFHPVRTSSAYEYNEKYTDHITDLSPAFNTKVNWNNIANVRRTKGQLTTYYLCEWPKPPSANTFLVSPPHESIWVAWYAAANGLDGFLRWAFDSWPEEPLLSGDFPGPHGNWPAGDTFLCYPNGWSSRRLALMREGIQDYEKIQILREKCCAKYDRQEMLKPFIHADRISSTMIVKAQTTLAELSRRAVGQSVVRSIYIVRHADRYDVENEDWKAKIIRNGCNRRDPPISKRGFVQAHDTATWLSDKNINSVYASPYLRTIQTGNTIAEDLGLALKIEPGMSEGWHDKITSVRDRIAYFPNIDDTYVPKVLPSEPEEYPKMFMNRCHKMTKAVAEDTVGNVVFVGHAASCLVVATTLLKQNEKSIHRVETCGILHIDLLSNGSYILRQNKTDHISVSRKTAPWGFSD